jgi:hypothetical protein
MFTDGLQRLLLHYETQTPHIPFFEPVFAQLENAECCARLNEELRSFLDSRAVNQRTDDDKTLVLAARTS